MSLPKKILEAHPEFVDVYNEFSGCLRDEVAEVIAEKTGIDVRPNDLPQVRFVDNKRTRDLLPQLRGWQTPQSIISEKTLLGGQVILVEIHPRAIAARAEAVQLQLGENKVEEFKRKWRIGSVRVARHLLNESAVQLMVEAMLIDTPESDSQLNSVEVYSEAYNRALAKKKNG